MHLWDRDTNTNTNALCRLTALRWERDATAGFKLCSVPFSSSRHPCRTIVGSPLQFSQFVVFCRPVVFFSLLTNNRLEPFVIVACEWRDTLDEIVLQDVQHKRDVTLSIALDFPTVYPPVRFDIQIQIRATQCQVSCAYLFRVAASR